jgi:Zn-dependent M28 family amino/carboxypeptidase
MVTKSRLALAAACAATLAFAPAASANGVNDSPRDPEAKRFVANVSVPSIVKHQIELQKIASLNGDTREVFGTGYTESVNYVVKTLKAAGYNPKVTPFNFPVWGEAKPPVLNWNNGTPPKSYKPGTEADNNTPNVDFITMFDSPTAELVNTAVIPVNDNIDPPTGGSTAGCEPEDFPAAVSGKIALVQRGTCAFVQKWANAEAAGALGIIIYNEGNNDTRQNALFIDDAREATIPAVISSYAVGNELLQAYKAGKNPRVDFKVYGTFTDRFLPHVLAETKDGDKNNVVVVGAHLDSVPEGPGINDDGSGTAALLSMAEEVARGHYNLRQKIRFAWWGAEENGLVGSSYYAKTLSDAEVKKIDVMLDYDMLASPNYIRGIYDGDGDDPSEDPNVPNPPGPVGSGRVEDVFDEWFKAQGMKSERGAFDGRSDYVGFTLRGIPSGGVFAGAEGVKTAEQEKIYGGAAGAWYDPCYHQICDNLQTVISGVPPISADGFTEEGVFPDDAAKKAAARKMKGGALRSLKELSGAASYGVYYWAMSKDGFNSKPHGGKPPKWPPRHRWHGHDHRKNG